MGNEANIEEVVNVPKKFLIETITGIFVFVIIAIAAVALSYFVIFLKSHGVDVVIIVGLTIAEYGIFTVDLILFFRFLWRTSVKTWGEL